MASKDLKTNINTVVAFDNTTFDSNTTIQGNVVDTKGFESVTFSNIVGIVTDGTFTPEILDCDTSDGTFIAVADDFLVGAEAQAALTVSNTTSKIGYIGKKRFVREDFTSTFVTLGVDSISSTAILGSPLHAPTAYLLFNLLNI